MARVANADYAVVAVDCEERIGGYDLVDEVRRICNGLNQSGGDCGEKSCCTADTSTDVDTLQTTIAAKQTQIEILPVTPWGKFVPALNAIVAWAARRNVRYLMLASAEVQLSGGVVERMKRALDLEKTLVVGAVLQGHQYHAPTESNTDELQVELTGRTTPWNTLALWNLPVLALTGFLLVSEGLHPEEDGGEGSSGVEEVVTIATLQKILSPNTAQAKLMSIQSPDAVVWGQNFGDDVGRREWHERKMMSKFTRAKRQLDLMGLSGTVLHC
eukprot:g12661.t1 g12661   contig6:2375981-2377059(+)